MRIIYMPSVFRKAYDYTIKINVLHEFRFQYEQKLANWKNLRETYGVSDKDLAKQFGFSRATYYRKRRILNERNAGRVPIRKPQRAPETRIWGGAEIGLVLKIRRENLTCGKAKITVILKRDHGFKMSESAVGRILDYLKKKGKITRSVSARRTKRKRNFKRFKSSLERIFSYIGQ